MINFSNITQVPIIDNTYMEHVMLQSANALIDKIYVMCIVSFIGGVIITYLWIKTGKKK